MNDRRNFDRTTRIEIIKRACASREDGQPSCEKCGAIGVPLEVHHLMMDAMETPEAKKARRLTAADGALWCEDCHDPETAKQRRELAKVQAVEARHYGADKPKSPMRTREKPPKPPLVTAPGMSNLARRFRSEI